MKQKNKPLTYSDYLQLDKLLNAQQLKSEEVGKPQHDELFFIIIHQTYELWFKQILAELNQVIRFMQQMDQSLLHLSEVLNSLDRIVKIQLLLNQQIPVLETLSPTQFFSFRDLLGTASGNQSYQFRLIEIRLGLYFKKPVTEQSFFSNFEAAQQQLFETEATQPNLFSVIESWLLHYTKDAKQYLSHYKQDLDTKLIELATRQQQKNQVSNIQFEQLKSMQDLFEQILNPKAYQEEIDQGLRRLDYQSFLAALFLSLNQNELQFINAYKVLKKVIEIDELMAVWRYHHALMVQRMIGNKTGTGGSTGYQYLRGTVEKNRVFTEFTNLSSYLFSGVYLDY